MNLSGKKAKLKKTMTTHAGTLYEGNIVKVVRIENGDYRVTDDMGKIWYVPVGNLVELKIKNKSVFWNFRSYLFYVSGERLKFFENWKVSEPTGTDMGLTE